MDPASWGLVLLAMAAGSVSALPVAGLIIRKFGEKQVVRYGSILAGLALAGIGLGYVGGVVPVVISLYLLGFGVGAWDVAMNVQGTAVEYRLRRAIMPRFHAGFSVGTVAGALLGALLIQLGVGIAANLVAVGVLVAVAVAIQAAGFLSAGRAPQDDAPVGSLADTQADPADSALPEGPGPATLTLQEAWLEPRTLLVGLSVMIFAFTEGTAIDWVGVALVEDYGTAVAMGTLGLATFLTTMTLSRWFGTELLDRFGRVAVLRTQAAVALLGVLVFVFSGNVALAFVGVALWGFGASLGFPVGMSAGGDDQRNAPVRVSVIATIGYISFLAGPPLVGALGQSVGVLWALMSVAAVLPIAFLIAGALRRPEVPA